MKKGNYLKGNHLFMSVQLNWTSFS